MALANLGPVLPLVVVLCVAVAFLFYKMRIVCLKLDALSPPIVKEPEVAAPAPAPVSVPVPETVPAPAPEVDDEELDKLKEVLRSEGKSCKSAAE
jgi:hypothetical protein